MAASGAPSPDLAEIFARQMTARGGFEPQPTLAIAVSGGADSLALTLLASDWAAAQGGRVLALTVDHGLRVESAQEVARVAGWLSARGIAHETLRWTGPKPATGLQAAARQARYALLGQRCREAGILHLLVAHHAEDQAETVALRRAAGSGPDGLAGMAACVEDTDFRILRPLLTIRRQILRDWLRGQGMGWIDDPSNDDPRFTRVRLRQALSGEDINALLAAAQEAGLDRQARDRRLARLLVRLATRRDDGAVELDRAGLRGVEKADALAFLARCILAVGGRDYAPRSDSLERLWVAFSHEVPPLRGRTLGGCVISPLRRGGTDRLLMRPERRAEGRDRPGFGLEAEPDADHLNSSKQVASKRIAPESASTGAFRPLASADFAVARPVSRVI